MIKAALDENNALVKSETAPRMIGEIKYFAMNTPPSHCLACDGSAVSRTTYAALFAAIGTTWGAGDGANTFNLPDLRDVWILCAGTEHEVGDSVAEGLPNITGETVARIVKDDAVSGTGDAYTLFSQAASIGALASTGVITSQKIFSLALGIGDSVRASLEFLGCYLRLNASNSSSIYGASTHVTPKSKALKACIIYE